MTVIVSLTPAAMLALGAGGALCLGAYAAGHARLFRKWLAPWRAQADVAQQLATFSDAIPGMLFTIRRDRAGHDSMPHASRGIVDLFGCTPAEVAKSLKPLDRLIEARDLPKLLRAFDDAIDDPAAGCAEYRIDHPVKGARWIVTHCRGRRLADGCTIWHGYSYDITEQKRAEHQRAHDYHTLVESSPDSIVRYDRQCRRVYGNLTFARICEIAPEEFLGKTPAETSTFDPELAARYQARLQRILETGNDDEIEISRVSESGEATHFSVRATPEYDLDGSISGVLTIARDVTRHVRVEEQLRQLALYDALTGLPNRSLLLERLEKMLHKAGSGAGPSPQVGLMLLDLDDFKDVNDVLGHACGDRLLAEVAKRLARSLSPADMVARLGGDEFAIVVSFSDEDFDLAFLASRVLVALSGPVDIEGREVFVTASIGVARYPKDGTDAAELLRYADAAMYLAKRNGGNRFCFHDAAAARAASERLELGHALRAAREQGELALLFQPIVALPGGQLLGAEALLRWDHPSRGRLAPDQFIGVAEANGTIVDIGAWVIAEACRCAVRWNALASMPLRVSVNVSARQFVMNDVAQTVREALAATGCAAGWLTVEITESLLLEDSFPVRRSLEDLSRMGVAIAIDDFGTGYSSMSYLGKFPIDMLKIDRSFVRDVDGDAKMRALVKAIVSVAGALSLEVVAEGIETQAQADTLVELGCGKAQGYLFGRPMPGASFSESLELAMH
ncbi:EAL domain-containing protein [Trinickia terrae]|uniref:EAL domain-containing protein n=1 Tax=Trinickia terrae TaxID=2571161 RepID=A0A4U1ID12_9BURK|nr:bifunctional diguanylate cyclase/phosphodiesterase [Trinickia terrae]TKC91498.1 EAL domain-containing protein [Trinickia terrae]